MKKLCVGVLTLCAVLTLVFILKEGKSNSPKLLPLNPGAGEYDSYIVGSQEEMQVSVSGDEAFPVTVVVQSPDAERIEFALGADGSVSQIRMVGTTWTVEEYPDDPLVVTLKKQWDSQIEEEDGSVRFSVTDVSGVRTEGSHKVVVKR